MKRLDKYMLARSRALVAVALTNEGYLEVTQST